MRKIIQPCPFIVSVIFRRAPNIKDMEASNIPPPGSDLTAILMLVTNVNAFYFFDSIPENLARLELNIGSTTFDVWMRFNRVDLVLIADSLSVFAPGKVTRLQREKKNHILF